MLQGLRGARPIGAGEETGVERSLGWDMARKGASKT